MRRAICPVRVSQRSPGRQDFRYELQLGQNPVEEAERKTFSLVLGYANLLVWESLKYSEWWSMGQRAKNWTQRIGAVGLLLVVQIWVIHHLGSEHHQHGVDHHHSHSSELAGNSHSHDNQSQHSSQDHQLASTLFVKKITSARPPIAVCPDIEIVLAQPIMVSWLLPDISPPPKIEPRLRCQPRAPPSLFVI